MILFVFQLSIFMFPCSSCWLHPVWLGTMRLLKAPESQAKVNYLYSNIYICQYTLWAKLYKTPYIYRMFCTTIKGTWCMCRRQTKSEDPWRGGTNFDLSKEGRNCFEFKSFKFAYNSATNMFAQTDCGVTLQWPVLAQES